VKDNMHKELQNLVCFNLGRRSDDALPEYLTLRQVLLAAAVLFLVVYALDELARRLAVNVLVPFFGIGK